MCWKHDWVLCSSSSPTFFRNDVDTLTCYAKPIYFSSQKKRGSVNAVKSCRNNVNVSKWRNKRNRLLATMCRSVFLNCVTSFKHRHDVCVLLSANAVKNLADYVACYITKATTTTMKSILFELLAIYLSVRWCWHLCCHKYSVPRG